VQNDRIALFELADDLRERPRIRNGNAVDALYQIAFAESFTAVRLLDVRYVAFRASRLYFVASGAVNSESESPKGRVSGLAVSGVRVLDVSSVERLTIGRSPRRILADFRSTPAALSRRKATFTDCSGDAAATFAIRS